MNLPNRLTFSRLLVTPLVFLAWYVAFRLDVWVGGMIVLWWVVLAYGEISDMLDGLIARRYNLISDYGKIMDPFVDVLFRLTYFLCFVGSGVMPLWVFMLIFWRELTMMALRTLLLQRGTVLPAGFSGKVKAVLYFLTSLADVILLTVQGLAVRVSWIGGFADFVYWFCIVSGLVSIVSFLEYVVKYLVREKKRSLGGGKS